MPRLPNMTTPINGLSEAIAATALSTTASTTSSSALDHLQAPTNASRSLSSNSSLNSSSIKSIASRTIDGTSTEKKRKSLSNSRQKKFHRRFKQVEMDEEVINCTYQTYFINFKMFSTVEIFIIVDFSCAFVSDILLQGYLYITKNYIAFYSNVFGYVTKLLIPITSVARISKEKTVKIIPNAIAVATIDERHVFSSFLSREAAYQLIISVWKEALPMRDIDVMSTSAQLRICTAAPAANSCDTNSESKLIADPSVSENVNNLPSCTLQVVHQHRNISNSGLSEIDDETSSASEGLTKLIKSQKPSSSSYSNSNSNPSTCNFCIRRESNSDVNVSKCLNEIKSLTSTPKIARTIDKLNSAFGETSNINFFTFKIPRTINIIYFGLSLVIILALLAGFLLYRISEMKNTKFSLDDLNTVRGVNFVFINHV